MEAAAADVQRLPGRHERQQALGEEVEAARALSQERARLPQQVHRGLVQPRQQARAAALLLSPQRGQRLRLREGRQGEHPGLRLRAGSRRALSAPRTRGLALSALPLIL